MTTKRADQGLQIRSANRGSFLTFQVHTASAWMVLIASLATACGPAGEPDTAWEPALASQALDGDNGLTTNGLTTNGLTTNGLTTNGLTTNGLSSLAFRTWFELDPVMANTLMHYVVLCAVPAGQVREYTNVLSGQTYSWEGRLGLAHGWANGQAPTLAEQQLVSACLAAHVNKYQEHVSISVLGRNSCGQDVPFTASELATHPRREACVFGNLFNQEGIFVGNDGPELTTSQSTTRACTLAGAPGTAQVSNCGPIVQVGSCSTHCTPDLTGTFYTSCSYNGVTYKPLTTRLRNEDVFQCGDGVCQITEHCGNSNTADSCQQDCGSCN
jgi:hypothetical protein